VGINGPNFKPVGAVTVVFPGVRIRR